MNGKFEFLLKWPSIIIAAIICWPVGLLLAVIKLCKHYKFKKQASNWRKSRAAEKNTDNRNNLLLDDLSAQEDLVQRGKEIESALQKELYCNRKNRPREILAATKWILLAMAVVIFIYVRHMYQTLNGTDDVAVEISAVLGTLVFVGFFIMLLIFFSRFSKEAKHQNDLQAEWIQKRHQNTFDTFVFAHHLEQSLLELGFTYGEHDKVSSDNEAKHFYKIDKITEAKLGHKFLGNTVQSLNSYRFEFADTMFDGNRLFDKFTGNGDKLSFVSPRVFNKEVRVIAREYQYGSGVIENLYDYQMITVDNSQFESVFATYAMESVDAFKLLTPFFMEKVLAVNSSVKIKRIVGLPNCVTVYLDACFNRFQNPLKGYDVQAAKTNAENLAKQFYQFIKEAEALRK